MKQHRYLALGAGASLLLVTLIAYLMLRHPDAVPWCAAAHCTSQRLAFGIVKPLYLDTWPIALTFLGMSFTRESTFFSWLTFFGFAALIPLCLVLAAEPVQTGFFPGPFPDRTGMGFAMSLLLAALSGVYVLARWVRWRRATVNKEVRGVDLQ